MQIIHMLEDFVVVILGHRLKYRVDVPFSQTHRSKATRQHADTWGRKSGAIEAFSPNNAESSVLLYCQCELLQREMGLNRSIHEGGHLKIVKKLLNQQ